MEDVEMVVWFVLGGGMVLLGVGGMVFEIVREVFRKEK